MSRMAATSFAQTAVNLRVSCTLACWNFSPNGEGSRAKRVDSLVATQVCKSRLSGKAPAFTAQPNRPVTRVVKVRAEEGGKVTTVRDVRFGVEEEAA